MPRTIDVPTSTSPASRAAVTAIVRELWRKSLVSVPAGDTTTRSIRFPFIGTLFDLVLPDCGGLELIPILHSPWRPDDRSGVVDGDDAQSPGDQEPVPVPGRIHRIGRKSLVNDKVLEDRSVTDIGAYVSESNSALTANNVSAQSLRYTSLRDNRPVMLVDESTR